MPPPHHRPDRNRTAGVVLAALVLPTFLLTTAAAASATPATSEATPCDDLLVSHRPDGSVGDTGAAPITAQAFERGAAGWALVGWEPAEDTDLHTVVVEDADGPRELPGTARSAEGDVLALHLCGVRGSASPPTVDRARDGDDLLAGSDGPATSARVVTAGATTTGDDGAPAALGFLGAAIGAVTGGVVLLLSRNARRDREVTR